MASRVRILPPLAIALAAFASLKAAGLMSDARAIAADSKSETIAEEAGEGAAGPEAQSAAGGEPASAIAASEGAGAAACAAPGVAEQAGLSQQEVRVLETLGERRKALEGREAEMATRESLLAAAEKQVETRIAELKKLEKSVETLIGQLDEAEAKQLAGLVNVYSKMKAKDAARIFNDLDEKVLLDVASRMKEQPLAEIMAAMAPERARKLTLALAQRKRDVENASAPEKEPAAGKPPVAAPEKAPPPNPKPDQQPAAKPQGKSA